MRRGRGCPALSQAKKPSSAWEKRQNGPILVISLGSGRCSPSPVPGGTAGLGGFVVFLGYYYFLNLQTKLPRRGCSLLVFFFPLLIVLHSRATLRLLLHLKTKKADTETYAAYLFFFSHTQSFIYLLKLLHFGGRDLYFPPLSELLFSAPGRVG